MVVVQVAAVGPAVDTTATAINRVYVLPESGRGALIEASLRVPVSPIGSG